MKTYHAERLAFIGDAAHSTGPLLGQSASMGFIDALTLAEKLRTKSTLKKALSSYSAERESHVRFQQAVSRNTTPFFQSSSWTKGLVRDFTFAIAQKTHYGRKPMASTLAGVHKGIFRKNNPGKWSKKYDFRK